MRWILLKAFPFGRLSLVTWPWWSKILVSKAVGVSKSSKISSSSLIEMPVAPLALTT
jgi:hypothetical protein